MEIMLKCSLDVLFRAIKQPPNFDQKDQQNSNSYEEEKCLSLKATQLLTSKIQLGYERIQKGLFAEENYQQLSLIIWILLNQFYKLDQMFKPISEQIIGLCINFFQLYRLNLNQRNTNVDQSNKDQSNRQYTFGLLIMLLGNTLASQEDVQLLLNKKIHLFDLAELLEPFINQHLENYEDVTFLISNILFYYPQDIPVLLKNKAISAKLCCEGAESDEERQLNTLSKSCKKQQLNIIKLLQNLCCKSHQAVLVFLRELVDRLNKKAQNLQYGEEKSFYHKILNSDNLFLFSQQQLFIMNKIPILHKNLTQNYIQDLFQCVDKTHIIFHNLLHSEIFLFRIPYIKPILEEKIIDNRIIFIFREVQLKLERLCQHIIHLLLISEYESFKESFPHLVLIPNKIFLFFLRDIFRKFNFQIESVPHYCLVRQYPMMMKALKRGVLQKKGREILKYCHRKIMGNQQKLIENKEMGVCFEQQREQFNGALWQIYEQIIGLSAPSRDDTEKKQIQKLFYEEIQWLQLRLLNAKIGLIGFKQIRKMVDILSKHFPLVIPFKQIGQSQQFKQQLDLNKLRQLLHFLTQKLVQFQEYEDYVLVFLSGIASVKQRIEKKELVIKVDEKWEKISSVQIKPFLIPEAIKNLLNELIISRYKLMEESDSIDGQIYRMALSILSIPQSNLIEEEVQQIQLF